MRILNYTNKNNGYAKNHKTWKWIYLSTAGEMLTVLLSVPIWEPENIYFILEHTFWVGLKNPKFKYVDLHISIEASFKGGLYILYRTKILIYSENLLGLWLYGLIKNTADFIKKVLSVYTYSMTTIYPSLSAQVAKSTFFMKSPV